MKRVPDQQGAVVLFATMAVLLIVTVITFFTARVILTDQKIFKNTSEAMLADNAAKAGFAFGLGYLNQQVVPVADGFTLGPTTLANNSSYTVLYTYVTPADNTIIEIKSTGTSPNGDGTRVIKAEVKRFRLGVPATTPGAFGQPITVPIASVKKGTLKNEAIVTNLENNTTMRLGKTVKIKNNAHTVIASGISSTKNSIEADIIENDPVLKNKPGDDLQNELFGQLLTDFKGMANTIFNFNGNHTFNSELNGITGEIIYLDMKGGKKKAKIDGSTVVGSAAEPVTIVVDGKLELKNNVIINGNVYATNNIDLKNNAQVNGLTFGLKKITLKNDANSTGAIVAAGNITIQNNATVVFSSSTLSDTQNKQYGSVSGSWKDF